MTMTLQQVTALIVGWAQDRNLIEGSTVEKQYLKLGEELGETYEAIGAENMAGLHDGLGDLYVVATIMAAQLGSSILCPTGVGAGRQATSVPGIVGLIGGAIARGKDPMPLIWELREHLEETGDGVFQEGILGCVLGAWEEIKDRKGRMVDGVFVKEGESQ